MDLEKTAVKRIQSASEMALNHYGKPLLVTDSGGKDSAVCRELVRRSGVPHEIIHNLTTADAPQTVLYIRERFREAEAAGIPCEIQYPYYKGKRVTMWSLIPQKKIPPTRLARYCCEVLKEGSGVGRFITTGVRWAESQKRKTGRGIYEAFDRNQAKKLILNNDNDDRRQLFESCRVRSKHICNPIVDWSDREVWDYIRSEKIPINPLYEMGFYRVGCIGCPMAGKHRYREFALFRLMNVHTKGRLKKCSLYGNWREKMIQPGDGLMQKAYSGGGWRTIPCRDSMNYSLMKIPMKCITDDFQMQ